jgi:hypothetical protein
MFDPTSRYYPIKDARYTEAGGNVVVYKRRRFLPQGEKLLSVAEVVVSQEDRLDLIAFRTLGRPEVFWRVADANDAMNPFDLTAVPGVTLRIPAPQAS